MAGARYSRSLVLAATASFFAACGGKEVAADARPATADAPIAADARAPDAAAPDALAADARPFAVTVAPDSATVGPHATVTYTFTRPVAPASVVVQGSLASYATWSLAAPDRLVVQPRDAWPDGAGNLAVTAADASGATVQALTTYIVDAVAPIATLRAGDLVLTNAQQGIVIRYSESMLESSLLLGGTLPAAVRPIWSGFMAEDDTLEIPAPAAGWPDGGTLTVDATDRVGNPANRMSFTVKLSP